MSTSRVYVILDAQVNTYQELFEIAKQVMNKGVGVFQLRDKCGSAKDILAFSKKMIKLVQGRALYFINDRVDLTLLCKADGVHLGQDDILPSEARKILSKSFLIGRSCQTLAHAKRAVKDKVDYIGFGSVYRTQTKPDRSPMDEKVLCSVYRNIALPVFAIGGIQTSNIAKLRELGVDRIALCRAICKDQKPSDKSQKFYQLITK